MQTLILSKFSYTIWLPNALQTFKTEHMRNFFKAPEKKINANELVATMNLIQISCWYNSTVFWVSLLRVALQQLIVIT